MFFLSLVRISTRDLEAYEAREPDLRVLEHWHGAGVVEEEGESVLGEHHHVTVQQGGQQLPRPLRSAGEVIRLPVNVNMSVYLVV